MTLSPGRSAQPSPPTDAASIIMDSTGERIIAAATPRAPPPTPDSSSIGSVNGRHWRSDSSWSLGSNSSTVASVAGGDGSVVKDTHEVVRRKASLPAVSPLGGPMLGGDCLLKSRCMVNQYALLDVLGTGSFGEVRLCLDTTTEERFAMKIVRKEREAAATRQAQTPPVDVMPADPSAPPPLTPRSRYHQQCEQLRSEIAVMKQLTHPNVIRLVEVMDDPNSNKMYLVRFVCVFRMCCFILHFMRSIDPFSILPLQIPKINYYRCWSTCNGAISSACFTGTQAGPRRARPWATTRPGPSADRWLRGCSICTIRCVVCGVPNTWAPILSISPLPLLLILDWTYRTNP